eukprot:SAG11_NODE_9196_length_934_cov_0.906587_2_plen_67_part_01
MGGGCRTKIVRNFIEPRSFNDFTSYRFRLHWLSVVGDTSDFKLKNSKIQNPVQKPKSYSVYLVPEPS